MSSERRCGCVVCKLTTENESLKLDRNLYDKGWDKVLAENAALKRELAGMKQKEFDRLGDVLKANHDTLLTAEESE